MIQEKFLEALERDGDRYDPESVARAVESGAAKLWVKGDSIVITEIVDYPQLRTLNIWLAAGNLGEVQALLPDIYQYGRDQGCTVAETTCRKGWSRVMARDGWETAKLVVMQKELWD